MDHVLNSISSFYDVYLDEFMEYQREGKYKKLSDNPMYGEVKAIIDAMNILRKYLGWENYKTVRRSKMEIGGLENGENNSPGKPKRRHR